MFSTNTDHGHHKTFIWDPRGFEFRYLALKFSDSVTAPDDFISYDRDTTLQIVSLGGSW